MTPFDIIENFLKNQCFKKHDSKYGHQDKNSTIESYSSLVGFENVYEIFLIKFHSKNLCSYFDLFWG